MCNVPFSLIFFVMLCHFRYYSLYSARLVASLFFPSLYKRQMIHIHAWSAAATTHVRRCFCEELRLRFDQNKCLRSRVSMKMKFGILLSVVLKIGLLIQL